MADPAISRAAIRTVQPPRSGGSTPPGPSAMQGPSGPPAPPPRPVVSRAAAPAPLVEPAQPIAVQAAAGLWFAACLAGLVGLGAALLDHDALWGALTDTATANDPAASAALVGAGVRATVVLVLGSVAALVVLQLIGTALLLRRRSAGRWILLITGVLSVAAADVAQSVVAGGTDIDRIAFLAQAGLVVLAGIALCTRSVRSWLRRPAA